MNEVATDLRWGHQNPSTMADESDAKLQIQAMPEFSLRLSTVKAERLSRLSSSRGVVAALAIDQRKSLRLMIANAAGVPLESISDEQLGEFKSAVTRALTPYASAVLLDPEFGSDAFGKRADTCGLLATYEMDGYENPRPHRMLALMPEWSVRRLRDLGADGIKILLSWTPLDDPAANDHKCALIERIGAECDALDMPFFLEPVSYDPGGLDPRSAEFSQRKPDVVISTMEEFSKEHYRVDILKVEFPINAAFVDGTSVFSGERIWSREQALDVFRKADAVSRLPYIYLSAGVSGQQFTESLRLASAAGARFSGVLCGRATWQEGVPEYARGGAEALNHWLARDGVTRIRAVNECLETATPWQSWTAAHA